MNFLVIIIVVGLTVIGGFAGTVYDSFWPAGLLGAIVGAVLGAIIVLVLLGKGR